MIAANRPLRKRWFSWSLLGLELLVILALIMLPWFAREGIFGWKPLSVDENPSSNSSVLDTTGQSTSPKITHLEPLTDHSTAKPASTSGQALTMSDQDSSISESAKPSSPSDHQGRQSDSIGRQNDKKAGTVAHTDSIAGRYRDLGDGIVLDVQTGLQWMRCALGQTWVRSACVNNANEYTWKAAQGAAKALNEADGYAGHQDWGIPTIDELKGVRNCKTGGLGNRIKTEAPCEDGYVLQRYLELAFPAPPRGFFWSSSPGAKGSDDAWGVDFYNGYVYKLSKSYQTYVRLVRGR